MNPIENLLPGSKFTGYIINSTYDKPTKLTFELMEDGRLSYPVDSIINDVVDWVDIGATPRDAIKARIESQERALAALERSIADLVKLQRTAYPIHPVLPLKEWKRKYPHLPEDMRLLDLSPQSLEERNFQWGLP